MGQIISSVRIENALHPAKAISCRALVDTGAAHLVLPRAWQSELGELKTVRKVSFELGDQRGGWGEICGPVTIAIEGFPEFSGEVLFIDMASKGGSYEPLLGYIPLEHAQAAIDMPKHQLVRVEHVLLK